MLWGNISKRKKKKESPQASKKKNGMQYFFEKNIDVVFWTTIFFSKNPSGLDIVSPFFFVHNFAIFFFIFSVTECSIAGLNPFGICQNLNLETNTSERLRQEIEW